MSSPTITQELPSTTTGNGRDSKGRFGVGNPGGPGREPGTGDKRQRVSVVHVLRDRYGEEGLRQRVADVFDALYLEAVAGGRDFVKAADTFLAHVVEVPEKGPLIAIGIGASTGPPIPDVSDFAKDLATLTAIALDAGVVEGEKLKPVKLIDTTAEVEDFLS